MSAGPRRCASRSSSTVATGSCRSAPTSSARTCRPPSSSRSRCGSPRSTARTPSRSRVRRPARRARSTQTAPPTRTARPRRTPDETSSAQRRGPHPRRRRAGAHHRRGDAVARGPADQEAAGPTGTHGREPVLRGQHPHADLVRGGRQTLVGRRHQLLREGLLALQGREPQGHLADTGGHGRRRGRRTPLGVRRPAPAGQRRLVQEQRGQRRRWDPRAPDAGPARRVHDVATPGAEEGAEPRRPPRRDRRRRAAQPGRPLERATAQDAGRRGHPGSSSHTAAGGRGGLGRRNLVRPRHGAAQGRRGDDAPGATGADECGLLPDRPRVQPPLRARRPPNGDVAGPHDRHAPGPDDPRHGDHRGRRGLAAIGDRRAGHQRCRRADGRAVPAARRQPTCSVDGRRRRVTRYLIRNARILGGDPTHLLLADGVLAGIGTDLAADDAEVVSADGLVAMPGLVDLHTPLREPGREDAETVETGTMAAALGGYTAVHAMANTDPVADTAGVVEQVWRLGREAGHCDVFPVGAVTVGLGGERLAELGAMADSAARVRVFSDDGKCVSDAVLMRRALEYVKAFDGVIAQHAQEPRLTEDAQMNEGELSGRLGLRGWPAVAEEAIIARDCLLAAHVDSRLHVCHVSTAGSVEIVRWAKEKGWNVTAEVCPHHLLLTDELAATYDPIYKVTPPLRSATDVEALRQGLADGTIDVVATDHAPHPHEDKDCEWQAAAFGMLGLETALSIVQETMVDTGLLDWAGVAERMAHTPARIGRLSGHGRPLEAGEPANVVLYDPASPHVVDATDLASLSRNTPYAGRELPGRVVATFLRGTPTVLDGKLR